MNRQNQPATTDKKSHFNIRPFKDDDTDAIIELFINTVRIINSADYDDAQIAAWTHCPDRTKWLETLKSHYSLVAVHGGVIVGFGDMTDSGYLDRLYVHADFQRQGIASAICDLLEAHITGDVVTHASITVKPFFEKRGYLVITPQTVTKHGVDFKNYVMKKRK